MIQKAFDSSGGPGVDGDIWRNLATKADKTELSELWDVKSNKEDLELAMKAIDISHHQLLHTIVMMIETILLEMNKEKLVKQAYLTK